jgi:uncharacterized protein
MIVDPAGNFVTQRELTRLALVNTSLIDAAIRLEAPGLEPLELPLQHEVTERRHIRVWQHDGQAAPHAAGSAWISRYLGSPHELVYMPNDETRPVNPERARADDIVSYADGYPFLLISEASLADLNARLESPVPMQRFRPNIVVGGTSAFAEDDFAALTIASIGFRGVKRCDRCSVTTIDIETGQRGKEPLRTLATYRAVEGKVYFGMNLIHDAAGTLRVGDRVQMAT